MTNAKSPFCPPNSTSYKYTVFLNGYCFPADLKMDTWEENIFRYTDMNVKKKLNIKIAKEKQKGMAPLFWWWVTACNLVMTINRCWNPSHSVFILWNGCVLINSSCFNVSEKGSNYIKSFGSASRSNHFQNFGFLHCRASYSVGLLQSILHACRQHLLLVNLSGFCTSILCGELRPTHMYCKHCRSYPAPWMSGFLK